MKLTQKQYELLRHTLTGGSGKEYRNRYCCGPGHSGYPVCRELVDLGLMVERSSAMLHEGDVFFHATSEGIDAWRAAVREKRTATANGGAE